MRELLRRFWRELWYDPVAEHQGAKELLAKRLVWSEEGEKSRRRAKLRLWRSDHPPKDS